MTRAPLSESAVTYGAVGGTRAADLLDYPPAGFRPLERRAVVGHGDERWEWAWSQTLSWGIQRRSGMRIAVEPVEAAELSYQPVAFDEQGRPVAAAVVGDGGEQTYLPDGSPVLRAGDSAWLGIRVWPFRFRFPARVVYVVDEPNRRGFAYGTLPGHAECGEEAFLAERGDDGSVSVVIRAFSRPANLGWWLLGPALRIAQAVFTARYLRALAGPMD